jgi:Co/Zn/Cd efflux system component
MHDPNPALRTTIWLVALLNLAYFVIEFAVAHSIGSVALFADSIDFLEDAAINALILVALGWSARHRAALGMVLAGSCSPRGFVTLRTACHTLVEPGPPDATPPPATGSGAPAHQPACAHRRARFRTRSGSLTRAASLSARNDALANLGIMAAGGAAIVTRAAWPDWWLA